MLKHFFPQPSSQIEYHESDGFRGVAILLVFGFHYYALFLSPNLATSNLLSIIFYSGAYGVQLFFVLSAYLLFRPQYQYLISGQSQTPISHFLLRRFLRIAPLYYLCLLCVAYILEPKYLTIESFHHLLAHFLFVHNFFSKTEYSIIDVAWSLGVEFIFYFILILLTTLLFKLRILNYKIRIIFYALIMLSLVIIVLKFSSNTNVVPIASMVSFLCGLGAAIIATHISKLKCNRFLLTGFGVVILIVVYNIHSSLSHNNYPILFHVFFILHLPIISVCYAALIIIASQQDYVLYPIFSWLPLRIIGLFSYEIYLVHFIILGFAPQKLFFFKELQAYNHFGAAIYVLLLLLLVGGILHFCISRPFMKMSSYLVGNKSNVPMPKILRGLLAAFLLIIITPFVYFIYQHQYPTDTTNNLLKMEILPKQSVLKKLYESNTTVHLDGLSEADFFTPKNQIKLSWQNHQLFMESEDTDPHVVTAKPLSLQINHLYVLRLVLESPRTTQFQLFYSTLKHPSFSEDRAITFPLQQGHNELHVPLQINDDPIQQLRLDPSTHVGRYVLSEFVIKQFD
jgi:peptidoglycan/LPS O-acetylase OafA/YrhL